MDLIAVEVTGISIFAPYQAYVVILKETGGSRALPIFIGAPEAHNIQLLLQGVKYIRPLTYDLFKDLLDVAETKINRVIVTDLRDSTFFAEIEIKVKSTLHKIDARPSDAIALAIKTEAPIFVNSKVLMEADLVGETTNPTQEFKKKIGSLSKQLDQAVEIEAYEEAALIRDQILLLEKLDSS
ncbi:MAG: bifunctional nuclease family protein [Calditrichaeota bacterium]|nr:bifunctional nuclease family protein [Calditrichota bacterium]